MRPLLASFFDGLDGVTYFFVSSAIFILVPAVLFFSLGLWIGALTWGRYKRRFRAGQETIEDMKNELALLKRRTAELASRSLPHQPGQTRANLRSPASPPIESAPQPNPPEHPRSHAFTLWTEHAWNPRPPKASAPPRGTSFTIWTEPGFEPAPKSVPQPSQENPPSTARPPVAAGAASTVKSNTGFPKAGAGTPTFGEWLHFQATGRENGDSPGLRGSISPADAFRAELSAGIARNDYLLGIVFTTPPAQRDDLSRLNDITASECDALRAYGVHTFKQIGLWDRDHAEEFARRLGLRDKSRAAKWIREAVKLHQESGGGPS